MYKNDVQFFFVYIKEAHALDSRSPMTFGMVEDPITMVERHMVAATCTEFMELEMEVIVDTMDDQVNLAYGGAPTRLYLVGKDGNIAYAGGQGPFDYKPPELKAAIEAELEKTGNK